MVASITGFSGDWQTCRDLRLNTEILAQKNHRITECSGLAGTSVGQPSPTLLLKQGHPEQAAQDLVQAGLEYLQRRRLHIES